MTHIPCLILLFSLWIFEHINVNAQPVDDAPEAEAWLCDESLQPLDPNQSQVNLTLGSTVRICIQPTTQARNQRIALRSIERFSFSKGERGRDGIQTVIEDGELVSPDKARIFCQPGASLCSFQTILMDAFFFPPILGDTELAPSNSVLQGIGAVSVEFGNGGNGRLLHDTVYLRVSRRVQVGSIVGTAEIMVTDIPITEQAHETEPTRKANEGFQEMWEGIPRWGQALCGIVTLLFLVFCCCCTAFGWWLAGGEIAGLKKRKKEVQGGDPLPDASRLTILCHAGDDDNLSAITTGDPNSQHASRNNSRTPRPATQPSASKRPSNSWNTMMALPKSQQNFEPAKGSSQEIVEQSAPASAPKCQPLPTRRHKSQVQQPGFQKKRPSLLVGRSDDNELPQGSRPVVKSPRIPQGRHSLHDNNGIGKSNLALPTPETRQLLGRHSAHGSVAPSANGRQRPRPLRRPSLQSQRLPSNPNSDFSTRNVPFPQNNNNPRPNYQSQQLGSHSAHGNVDRGASIRQQPRPLRRPSLQNQRPTPRLDSFAEEHSSSRQNTGQSRASLQRHSLHGGSGMNISNSSLAFPERQQQLGRHSAHGNFNRGVYGRQQPRPLRRPSLQSQPPTSLDSFAKEEASISLRQTNSQSRAPLQRHSLHGDSRVRIQARQQPLGLHSAHGNFDRRVVTNGGSHHRPLIRSQTPALVRQDSGDISISSGSFAADDDEDFGLPRVLSQGSSMNKRSSQSVPPMRIAMRPSSNSKTGNDPASKVIDDDDDDDDDSDASFAFSEVDTGSVASSSKRVPRMQHTPKRIASNASETSSRTSAVSASKKAVPRKRPPKRFSSNASEASSIKSSSKSVPRKHPPRRLSSNASDTGSVASTTFKTTAPPQKHPPRRLSSNASETSSAAASPSNAALPRKKRPPKKRLSSNASPESISVDAGASAAAAASPTAPRKHPPTKKLSSNASESNQGAVVSTSTTFKKTVPRKHPPKKLSSHASSNGESSSCSAVVVSSGGASTKSVPAKKHTPKKHPSTKKSLSSSRTTLPQQRRESSS